MSFRHFAILKDRLGTKGVGKITLNFDEEKEYTYTNMFGRD